MQQIQKLTAEPPARQKLARTWPELDQVLVNVHVHAHVHVHVHVHVHIHVHVLVHVHIHVHVQAQVQAKANAMAIASQWSGRLEKTATTMRRDNGKKLK